jgi:uncharacterized protein (DUF1499 family)
MVGFGLFVLGGVLALGAALATLVQALRRRRTSTGGLAAVALSAVFLLVTVRSSGPPPINDFTTDLAEPPAFRHATALPANAGRDMTYPPAFAEVQRACCADLQPLRLPVAPAEALARARRLAEGMPGWHVTAAEGDTIEAVSTSRLFGFQDDVAVRVRADGAGASRVDVRSKSRDGRGDLGVNAARIRAYLAALAAGR